MHRVAMRTASGLSRCWNRFNNGSNVLETNERKTDALYKKGLYLEYLTITYNFGEAIVSLVFGGLAGSIALIGFGLDAVIESFSGMILVWRLRQRGKVSEEEEAKIEKKAMKFVAVSFFILGIYILEESIRKLAIKKTSMGIHYL